MGAPDVLQHLRAAGLHFSVTAEGRLRVAPRDVLTDEHCASIRAHRSELLALVAGDQADRPAGIDADSWCWPHSDAMNTAELETFVQRVCHFINNGAREHADRLAVRLVRRDREGDDRVMCVECQHGRAAHCPDGAPMPMGVFNCCDYFKEQI